MKRTVWVLRFNWSKKTRVRRCYATCLFAPAEYSHEPITAISDTWKGSVINVRCLNSDDVRWIRRFNDNTQQLRNDDWLCWDSSEISSTLNFSPLGLVLGVFEMQQTWKNVLQSASLVLSLSLPSSFKSIFSHIAFFVGDWSSFSILLRPEKWEIK